MAIFLDISTNVFKHPSKSMNSTGFFCLISERLLSLKKQYYKLRKIKSPPNLTDIDTIFANLTVKSKMKWFF